VPILLRGVRRRHVFHWGEAFDRIARILKDDRDKNFVAKNNDDVTVNRWTSTGFLAASATTNETAFCTYKVVLKAEAARDAGIRFGRRWPSKTTYTKSMTP
jgi:hypothetical protein